MQTCGGCGRENPEGFAFCGFCGDPFKAQATPTEERRLVSVLFVDLVGFTERSDRADPEAVQGLLRPYYASVKHEIEAFGGTVEKFIGDAIVGVFGVPRIHEDDPERAVRCAMRTLEAIHELNAEEPGLNLSVRIGVNTGEAIVSLDARPELGEGFVSGDAINTASRLQTLAEPDSVLVGESTQKLTGHAIEYQRLEPVQVKGKSDPIPVWRAIRALPLESGRGRPGAAVPLIGRDDDLALLETLYRRCRDRGQPQLVTIVGDAGAGKTRLVVEARPIAAEAIWRQGQCIPYGDGVTYWALGQIVKQEAAILDSDPPKIVDSKIRATVEALVEGAGERDWMASWIAPLVGTASLPGTEAGEHRDSFRAWASFFEAVASRAPLVLVFEDIQWAVDSLLDFVRYLCDASTKLPILVMCTARPELYDDHPTWGGGRRNSTVISLDPLTPKQTERLVTALLDGASLPPVTGDAMLHRCAGNPLYAQEFARMLVDTRALHSHAPDLKGIAVPETVQAIVAARLDAIPLPYKQVAQDAAVVGEIFWEGAMAEFGIAGDTIQEALDELARRELVARRPQSTVGGEAEYEFTHIVVRDVAYQQIPRAQRVLKHAAVARWLERVYGERMNDAAELLAHHYSCALDLAEAIGDHERTEELRPVARRFLTLAGDRAARLDAEAAGSYYRRAIALTPPGEPDRARILVRAGESAHQSGRLSDAATQYSDAVSEFRKMDDLLGAGEALVRLSRLRWWQGETDEGHQLLEEAIAMLERRQPGAELALACARMAGDHAMAGRHRDALKWAERSLTLARDLNLQDVEVRALQYRGLARCEGDDTRGLDDLRSALQKGLDLGLGHETATAYDNLGDWLWLTDGPTAGLDANRTGVEFALRRGQTETATWTRTETLWMLFDAGQWDEVLRVADEVITWDDAHGCNQVGVIARTYMALVALWRGDRERAEKLLAEVLPRARTIADAQVLVPALGASALSTFHRSPLEALEVVVELESLTRDKPVWRSRELPEVVSICMGADRPDLATRLVDGAAQQSTRPRLCVTTAQARIAEATDVDTAAGLYARAVEGWETFGAPLQLGRSLLGLARCVGARSPASARDSAARARDIITRLGAAGVALDSAPLTSRND